MALLLSFLLQDFSLKVILTQVSPDTRRAMYLSFLHPSRREWTPSLWFNLKAWLVDMYDVWVLRAV